MTRFACFEPRDLDGRLDPFGRFFERDLEVVPQVGSALGASAAAAAEQIAEPEHVAESAEDVFEAGERRRIEARARLRRDAGMPEPVIPAALLRVGENGVCLGRFLETFLGGMIARVAIGIILKRQFAIGALDLLIVGVFGNAQNVVVIAFAHALATFTMAGRSRRSPSRYPRLNSAITSPSRVSGAASYDTA